MKKILLLMLVFVGIWANTSYAQSYSYYYDYLNPTNVGTWIRGMHFVDNNTGFACSMGGNIHKTTNGGTDWTTTNYGGLNNLNDVFFIDAATGWVVGTGGVMLKTTDGGITWNALSSGTTLELSDVFFIDATTGWVSIGNGGDGGNATPASTILKTTNGGTTWTPYTVPVASTEINAIDFIDANIGFAAGSSQRVFRTTNGGLTWTAISVTPGSQNINALDATDANNVFIGGTNTFMRRTTNASAASVTWNTSVLTPTANTTVQSLCFWTPTNGVLTGAGGRIFITSDGGANWTTYQPIDPIASNVNKELTACAAPSGTAIYVGGRHGITLKSTNGGSSWSIGSYVDQKGTSGTSIGFWDNMYGMAGGFISGSGNVLLKTTDMGVNWQPVGGVPGSEIQAIEYMDLNTVLVGNVDGTSSGIYKSTNNGSPWTATPITGDVSTVGAAVCFDIFRVNSNMVVGCGSQSRFYKSVDGGSNWTASGGNSYAPIITVTGTSPTACGATNGSILISGLEVGKTYSISYTNNEVPVAPASYTASPTGQITLTNLATGRYTNIVASLNGCSSTPVSTLLVATGTPAFTSAITAPTTCGGSNGTITLTGGAGALANTTYSVSYIDDGVLVGPVNYITDGAKKIYITGLNAGVYAGITIKDAANCPRILATVLIQDPGSAFFSTTSIPPTSCGGTNGKLELTSLVANTTYAITYTNAGGVTGPFSITTDATGKAVITGLSAGLYSNVKVTNPVGCTRVLEMVGIGDQRASTYREVFFVDENIGYIVGSDGVAIKTINGGTTWNRLTTPFPLTAGSFGFINDVFFIDANNGYICGNNNQIYKTTDGGATWTAPVINSNPSGQHYNKIHFYDINNGIAYGGSGVMMVTHDAGATWTQEFGISGDVYQDVYVVDRKTAFIAAGTSSIVNVTTGDLSIIKQVRSCFDIDITVTKPSGAPNDPNIICTGESAVLTASAELANYLWSTGATTQLITVNQPGTYTVEVSYPEGCTKTASVTITSVPTPAPVCNNNVQISLDEDCSVLVNEDMVLEGDVYCDYDVEITGLTGVPSYGNIVTGANIGQVLKVKVTHILSGNSCWGQLTVEDKLPPVVQCANFNVSCAETNLTPGYLSATLGLPASPVVTENCSTYTPVFNDVWTELDCNTISNVTAQVTRTWFVTDGSGNTGSCVQTIQLIGARVDQVLYPIDVNIDCTAATNTSPTTTGVPYFVYNYPNGPITYKLSPDADHCELEVAYIDTELPVCDGTHKILRRWTAYDWCLPTSPFPPLTNPHYFTQVIKVADESGPSMVCPANMTVSTDPYDCCATVDLPNIIVSDNCSRINHVSAQVSTIDPATNAVINTFDVGGSLTTFSGNNLWSLDTLADLGSTPCLPVSGLALLSGHLVTYTATDDCGNHASCSFRLFVRDFTPPVAVCDEFTVVSVGIDDANDGYVVGAAPGDCQFGGVTWVPASTFDDGSYDNCGNIKLAVRRMDVSNDCVVLMNSTEIGTATNNGDEIKFYCCEVGTVQTIVLTVYQLDNAGNIAFGPAGQIKNECMVQVEVQDKIKPVCKAPVNVNVACELFDASLWAYGNAVPSDNCCLDTTKVYQGQCGLTHSVDYSQFDSLCNRGTITRSWKSYDCHGWESSVCKQSIVVNHNQSYSIKFPDDKVLSVCNGDANPYGAPTFTGEDCELLATSFVDEIFTVVPDACFKIERTWTVINWCTYTPNSQCTYVNNPDASTTGATVATPAGANCYKYKQIIKIIDTQDPTVVTPAAAEYCDYSTNDANYWNASYWWDGPIESHNMCEGEADIAITATDACSGSNVSFRYLLFLDLDGNGTMETVVPGNTVTTVFNEVRFNNVNTPGYAGGEARAFDFRNVQANQKWGFGLTVDAANGNNRTAHVRWVSPSNGAGVVPQLPYGTHKIKWFIEDGCGNELTSETTFTVKDCKKPTVVCVNGLSINQMNGPMNTVTLWASDFLVYGEDNCTPSPLLKYGIRKSGTGTGFPETGGVAQTSVTFGCTELNTQFVELWVKDKTGNADFCETYVLVQDNTGACGPVAGMATVAGALKNESVEGVEDAQIALDGSANGAPVLSEVFSNVSGGYAFNNALPITANATVTPQLDADPLNGVNTWDLVLISRHILGLEPLSSPYKLIAADANKSGTVTTFDIVELRKLILGTYSVLPNNSSWRFIDKAQQFTDNANPFADVIQENLQIANIQSNVNNGDFVGAKIGDVDGTATPNSLVSSDDRTAGTLLFDVTDRKVVAGETFTVNFKAAEKVAGYQFTMNFNGLEVVDIVPGAGMTTENFGVFADAITTSADATEGTFAVTFRAKQAGSLSNMLGVSSRITKAVAFTSATLGTGTSTALGNKLDVAFRYNNAGVSTIAGVGFELYQNAPNPFINKTVVGFHLPEAAEATLSVYDETGRVLYTTTGNFAKGYNAVQLERSLLSEVETGVLYYKLETVANSASKKMIQSK